MLWCQITQTLHHTSFRSRCRIYKLQFLGLFDSQEPSEREYLKTILHKIYAKVVPRRKMIRKAMNDLFYTLIH